MKTKLLPLILVIGFLYSCEKETAGPNNSPTLIIGDPSGMIVQSYNSWIEGGYNELVFQNLDLDNDGGQDFKITSQIWGSPGMGTHPTAKVFSLSAGRQFQTLLSNDTTYYRYEEEMVTEENRVNLIFTTTYDCQKKEAEDSVFAVATDQPRLHYLYPNDEMAKSDHYSVFDDGILLCTSGGYEAEVIPNVTQDTLRVYHTWHLSRCKSIPLGEDVYLGVRILHEDNEKLGWIKLKVEDNYRVFLYETAIQR